MLAFFQPGQGGPSGFLCIFPEICYPANMAAPRCARVTHQLARSVQDRSGCLKRVIRHEIGRVVAPSIVAARCRTRGMRRQFQRRRWRWRLRCRKENQRHLCVEPPVAGLVAPVRANGTLEEHGLYREVTVGCDIFKGSTRKRIFSNKRTKLSIGLQVICNSRTWNHLVEQG
jgi:hypothetical protein